MNQEIAVPLLKTKLYVPPDRTDLVARPRLGARIDAALRLGHKLTLLSAPAGFGKTTLVAMWIGQSERRERVAWVALDEGDNTPARFWTYVIAALQTVDADIGRAVLPALQASQLPPAEVLVTHLINDLAQQPDPLLLVLDDYHAIQTPDIHTALAFLLEHVPPQLHLVVTSRTDPPLPLPLLRGRRQITELRAADLRFTDDEAALLFNQVLGLALAAEDIDALEKRTEGWITGLQLAAHSLRGRADVAAFIRDLSGSQRYVLDYLVEEVLRCQPQDVQAFLMQTAILERMTGALCEAVTGQADGASMLARLERANLFLVPLDDHRQWYRYHQLFADLLRHQLAAAGGSLGCAPAPVLHGRASAWYAAQGLTDQAIRHALAAADFDRAADLIEQGATSFMARGELPQVLGWFEALPEALLQARPWLCVNLAWARLLNGRWDLALPHVQRAERLARTDSYAHERDSLLGHTASIRAYRAVEVPDIARAIEQAERARRLLPREARVTRSIALFTLGNAYRFNNDLARATDAYEQAVALGKEAEVVHILAPSVSALGRLRVQCGQLHRAAQVYRETLDRLSGPGGGLSPIAADVCSRLGDLYYEWNDLETAFSYLRRGVELGRAGMNAGLLVSNTLSLARALRAHGDVSEADAALQTADDLCRERGIHPRIRNLRIAHHGRLHVMRGDREAAARWMTDNALGVEDELGYAWQETYVALAQALTLLGRYDQALSLLARLLRMAQQVGCNGHVIKIQACRAMVFGAQDRADDAVAALSPALHLAEPEGYVRTFVDCGPMMADLLKQVALAGTAPAYVGTLLAAFKSEGPSVHTVKAGTDPARAALVEPLTDRELEVLRLIAAGLSNAEIAQELYVALSTVKKHINHLYGKLQVHRRIEAVVKARELGLL